MFVDVGGNYGTHSLLFLVHGVKALTFEPNSICYPYFELACELNTVVPAIVPVALGQSGGEVELLFPEYATWSGSVVESRKVRIREERDLKTTRVRRHTLDDYIMRLPAGNTLIKIDVEGGNMKYSWARAAS